MKNVPLISVMLVVLLVACGPSQEGQNATVTQIAANIFATQTAVAPTNTPTPTSTNTPSPTPTPTDTPTPTNTATPTQTPSPTPTPTATATPTLEASQSVEGIILTSKDMGPDFEMVTEAEMGLEGDPMLAEFDGFFAFTDDSLNVYMGLTQIVDDEAEQLTFDVLLSNPEFMGLSIATGFTGQSEEVSEPVIMEGVDDIGDTSVGVSIEAKIGETPTTIEVIIFRHGHVGAIVVTFSLFGGELMMETEEMARLLDAKIAESGAE